MKVSKDVIIQACLQKQEELVKNFDSRVTEIKDEAASQSQSASQSEDRNAGDIELLNTLDTELEFAQRELAYLKSLNASHESSIVEPGAVVVTDQRTFFIAVSSEKIEIDGQSIFGISTQAPIYSAMDGLKRGDTFEFNKTVYKIENIY